MPTFTILQQGWIDLASGRYTKAEIQRLMTKRGLQTKAGRPVSSQTIDNIFNDIFYAGLIRDPWSGEEYPGKHFPMISRETFDTVQRMIHRRNRSIPHLTLRPEFPLRSFARCSACEAALSRVRFQGDGTSITRTTIATITTASSDKTILCLRFISNSRRFCEK